MLLQNSYYRSSGKVSFIKLIPLTLATLIVSVIMAGILFIIDAFGLYYFIFAPLIISTPVLGMTFLTIHFGECRNRLVGMTCALISVFVFYFGYWTLGYAVYVVTEGPEAVEYMKTISGNGGVPGYIIYRCKTNIISGNEYDKKNKEPDTSDAVGSIIFYSFEILMLFGLAVVLGLTLPARVFYEDVKKWASSAEIRLIPQELEKALNAIRNNKWQDFGSIPKLPKIGNNHAFSSFLTLKFEFLKNSPAEPIYVTLSGYNISKNPVAKAEGAKGPKKVFIKKLMIDHEFYPLIALTLPELGLKWIQHASIPTSAAVTPISSVSQLEQPLSASAQPRSRQVKYSGGLKGLLENAGILQPEFTGPDFREKAVEVSRKLLKSVGDMVSPKDINQSLCFPVDENEKLRTNEISGISYGFLLLFFPCFFGGLVLLASGEDKADPLKSILMISGAVICLSGIICVCIGLGWRNFRAAGKLLNRPNALFDRYDNQKKELLRIEDPQTYNIHKRTPEDVCCCLLDQQNSRLLMEGCNFRYIIKGEDVIRIEPLETGQVVSIHLSYRIKDEELPLIIYKTSTGGAVLNPLFTMNAAKSFARKLKNVLSIPI